MLAGGWGEKRPARGGVGDRWTQLAPIGMEGHSFRRSLNSFDSSPTERAQFVYTADEMRGGESDDVRSTFMPGRIPRPLGGYQLGMMEPSSPSTAWQYHSAMMKQEPMENEERNDSGISGSEFHSSSPGSDHSGNIPYSAPGPTQPTQRSAYYPPAFMQPGTSSMFQNHPNLPAALYHSGLLTPPNSVPTVSPNSSHSPNGAKPGPSSGRNVLTPFSSPNEEPTPTTTSSGDCALDELRKLHITMEKNGTLAPALSPKSESSGEDCANDNDPEEDEQGLRTPKVNSHGKLKTYKCKQCDFVAVTKLDSWAHNKIHIPPEKLLSCTKCPFVTEYKHHLEYHLRNHYGSKPFKCDHCDYTCVNKSMLNSHLKSHSNIYQYRCSDCSYATKYCHSLKLHLRKYKHEPAMVLNPDGTPNPLPIIDVYGTRRGPKVKTQESKRAEDVTPSPDPIPFPLNQFLLNAAPQMQLPFAGFPFFPGLPNPLLFQNLEQLARERLAASASQNTDVMEPSAQNNSYSEVLDLSKPEETAPRSRRKGQAFKRPANFDDSSDDDEEITTMFSNVEVVENKETDKAEASEAREETHASNASKDDYNCQYCSINFGDPVLYTMHMGFGHVPFAEPKLVFVESSSVKLETTPIQNSRGGSCGKRGNGICTYPRADGGQMSPVLSVAEVTKRLWPGSNYLEDLLGDVPLATVRPFEGCGCNMMVLHLTMPFSYAAGSPFFRACAMSSRDAFTEFRILGKR
ncbi:hypothetical protein NQ317_009659 [Molorchus minor]|uniref:Protein hunchback n=1 Tax=Molorchus minor TaxID=1323400 RepID=A0ABQ9JIX4_9CUCU|nr:hypothetical protein NQ317_009659 [Molorchus minor]